MPTPLAGVEPNTNADIRLLTPAGKTRLTLPRNAAPLALATFGGFNLPYAIEPANADPNHSAEPNAATIRPAIHTMSNRSNLLSLVVNLTRAPYAEGVWNGLTSNT